MVLRFPARTTRFARLAPGALGVVLAASAGCSTLFGLDVPPLLQELDAGAGRGEGGAAGDGVSEAAGAGLGGSAPGGSPGGGSGGAGAKGGSRGGRAGSGGGAGVAGSAGASSGGGPARLNAPCDRPGALACPGGSATSTLVCEGGVWSEGTRCATGQYCDERNGSCAPVYPGCADASPGKKRCVQDGRGGYDAITCGLDLVSAVLEQCIFDCKKDVGCLPPTGNQLVLEPEVPPLVTERAFWPGPTIPVCVTNPEAKEWPSVEDEVARTWGRYGGIAFTGWAACDAGATGVIATLTPHAEPCRGYLGSVDRIGYPGPGGVLNLTLCTRYYNAAGDSQTMSDQLLRLVVRHELGHVLGFVDASGPNTPGDIMSRGLDIGNLDQYPFSSYNVALLVDAYGHKPPGALVDERGDCLALESGALSFTACDGSAAQAFAFSGGALVHPDAAECLAAAPSAGATAATCAADAGSTNDQGWQLAEVEIRGFGALCLQVGDGGTVDVDLCPEFGTPSALWSLEYVDAGTRVRLRQAGGTDCLTVEPATLDSFLAPCDDCPETDATCATVDRFTVTQAGQIRLDAYCFFEQVYNNGGHANVPASGPVELQPCALSPSMLWSASGRIESAVGTALTRPLEPGPSALIAAPTGNDALGSQIFDFYFPHGTP